MSEIETAINKLEFVEKAVVVADLGEDKKVNKIFAFIKQFEGNKKDVKEIRKIIKNCLPDYMIPVIRIVENFPLNVNGKIDEKKLLEKNR